MRAKAFLPLLLILAAVMPALSQVAITGQIRGVVTDASGALLPDVKITATSPALMAPRTVNSQKDGSYILDQLPVGTYQVTYSHAGFKSNVQQGVVITPGFTASVSPRLEVGSVDQSVQVTGEAPIVDVKGNETTTDFDNTLLQNIPSGRDTWSTVAQAPGVTSSNFDVAGNQSFQQAAMEVHGSAVGEQVYSFNGLRMNWPGATGGYTSFYVDNDALQDFQVVTDNAPADVGVGGVYMNMVPKSGSNTLHGMATIHYASAGTEAEITPPTYRGAPLTSAGSPIIMTRDTTAQLGGPLIKDRWWLFGSYRRYDIKESILSVTRQDGTPISDPNHQSNVLLRSDWQLTTNNRVNLVWWYNDQNRFFRRDTSFPFVSEEAAWRQIEPAYILQGQWNSLFHGVVFDTRAGYMHQIFPLGPEPIVGQNAFNRQDSLLGTESGAAPYYFVNPAQVLAFAEGVSFYKGNWAGSHNFKFGVDTSTNRNGYNYTALQGINAIYQAGTGTQVLAYNFPLQQRSNFHETAAYAQDTWTIKNRLTLNLGLRFDHFRTFNPQQTSPAAFFPDLFPTRTFAQSPDIANWNTVRPRIGVAYDLFGKGTSVLRASFDMFDVVMGTELAEAVNPNGFSTQVFNWTDANNDGIPQLNEWKTCSPCPAVSQAGGNVTRVDPNLKRPYSDEVNVGYEQQIWQDLRVGVNYYYRTTKNLYATRNMLNLPSDYTAVASAGGINFVNPITNQPITLYNLNPAKVGMTDDLITNISDLNNNAYHAVEFTATKRLTHHWQLLGGFTWQRKKGTYRRGTGDDFNNPNNNINRADNILDYDATHVLKIDSTFELPYKVQLSTNFQHYTGYPLDPNNGPPTSVFNGLNQGPVAVVVQPLGNIRLPNVDIWNMRLSRPTNLTERIKLEPIVDFFNILNRNTPTGEASVIANTTNVPQTDNFLRPTDQVLNPFIAKFGLKLTF